MQFIPLQNEEQLNRVSAAKEHQIILKHNTACTISNGVLERLQSEAETIGCIEAIHVLDLQAHRDLSNKVTGRFGVPHQSPQLLLIRNGKCTYHEWGVDITASNIARAVNKQ